MSRILAALLVCTVSLYAKADEPQQSFGDALDFAHGQEGVGMKEMKKFNPKKVFDNYTSNPKEASNYQGVTQTNSDLMDKGSKDFQKNKAGETVIQTVVNQPEIKISKDTDFVKKGKMVKDNASDITTGKYSGCKDKVINSSVFTQHQCTINKITDIPCTESSYIDWQPEDHWETVKEKKVIGTTDTYVSHTKGYITDVYVQGDAWKHHGDGYFDFHVNGHSVPTRIVDEDDHYYDHRGVYHVSGLHISSPGYVIHTKGNLGGNVSVVLTVKIKKTVIKPHVEWKKSCPFNVDNTGAQCTRIQHVCTIPGSTKTVKDKNGNAVSIHRDCWGYKDTFQCGLSSGGTCGAWQNDSNCHISKASCSLNIGGICLKQDVTYSCEKITQSSGMMCGEKFYCLDGQCDISTPTQNGNFGEQASKLAGAANAAHSAAGSGKSGPDMHAFTGKELSCRYDAAGFSNCCSDSGWGKDLQLAHCNRKEKELGKAKEKDKAVKAGTKCDHEILGVCVSHKKVYCVFDNVLAMIIQTQGRWGQLGVGFGSGEHPDCSGLTVEQLQKIDFNKIDFSKFYPQLKKDLNIPDQGVLTKKIKEKINQGVQQGGGNV